ncbi:uncharacterized protein LOC110113006 isoform X2 [Dendrobium catenatum]|uniref:uncharacterized protein LOC110113006 isoform X2 n=1 Tax=Dendrobium catenatum TaxID=906689 RepID=UPI0009F6DC1D|nr:uncharacterized protein LOC110113006 isoform X2 [Dendrobium catenatum]
MPPASSQRSLTTPSISVASTDRDKPHRPGPSFESAPNWEKRFCSQMKWRDFCEKKRVVHLFPKVLDWDDAAGKEAFDNAKARYWAQINNLPSEIPSPDPDMYVQEVDYDAYIDPSLLEDLYELPPPPPETPDPSSIKISEIIPTGWDVEDPPINNIPKYIFIKPSTADDIVDNSAPTIPTGCADGDKIDITAASITIIPTGWGDEENVEPNNAGNKNVENVLGNTENHSIYWQQDKRNDTMFSSEKLSSFEQRIDSRDRRYRRSGRDQFFDLNPANLRCHEQGYHKERWTKYIKEQYFWRQKHSLARGLSCTPENN